MMGVAAWAGVAPLGRSLPAVAGVETPSSREGGPAGTIQHFQMGLLGRDFYWRPVSRTGAARAMCDLCLCFLDGRSMRTAPWPSRFMAL